MNGKVKKGQHELFETTAGHQILTLDNKKWYAVVKGEKSDILVGSDSDHEKKKILTKGQYYYAEFKDDPEFQDTPHLFMKDGSQYREFILPNGFPSKKGDKVRVVRTGDKLSAAKVEAHVTGKGNTGQEKQYEDKPEGLRSKTKKELYALAKKQRLEGRSKMSKEELVKKLAK